MKNWTERLQVWTYKSPHQGINMTNVPFTPPKHLETSFNCPHCKAFAAQTWGEGVFGEPVHGPRTRQSYTEIKGVLFSKCSHCEKEAIWVDSKLVFPQISTAPQPASDLPDDLKRDYHEAREILINSPRGASALLRLVLQKLCKHLGEPGKDLNTDIASLVKRGLNPLIQKSLDSVRVIGNEAVHPGVMDLKDDPDSAGKLFTLINFIVETMISQPKEINNIYNSIPQGKRDQIEKRDSK